MNFRLIIAELEEVEELISEVINVDSPAVPAIPSRRRKPIVEDLNLTDVPTKKLREVAAKERPVTLVEGVFFDSKEKIKQFKDHVAQENLTKISTALQQMFTAAKMKVVSIDPKLGKFRGYAFLTSCKIAVAMPNEAAAQKFNDMLILKVSPKYKFKSYDENGIAYYNVR